MSSRQLQNFVILRRLLVQLKSYGLNPNDINGLACEFISLPLSLGLFAHPNASLGDGNLTSCPGVQVCCQVTALVGAASWPNFFSLPNI